MSLQNILKVDEKLNFKLFPNFIKISSFCTLKNALVVFNKLITWYNLKNK